MNTMMVFLHEIKLTLQIFLHVFDSYRVEVEKYYLTTGDISMLSFYFFKRFEDAQEFVKSYKRPFYRISLFAQNRGLSCLCNIYNEALVTKLDLSKVEMVKDRYGFQDIIGAKTKGWYRRGLNTHNPEFVEVTEDLEYMLMEGKRRYEQSKGKIGTRSIVREIFTERHRGVEGTYQKTFDKLLRISLNLEPMERSAK